MKLYISILCIWLCIFLSATKSEQDLNKEMSKLTVLLRTVSPKDDATNTGVKEQIQEIFQKINETSLRDQTLKKINLCSLAMTYIRLNTLKGNEECSGRVKDPDTSKLKELFHHLEPSVSEEIDKFISELLVDAVVSLKCLKHSDVYRNKLLCNAEKLGLIGKSSKVERFPDNPEEVLAPYVPYITHLLKTVDSKNDTIIATEISNSLISLRPVFCEDCSIPDDTFNALLKVKICQKALLFLRNTTGKGDCEDRVVAPDTSPLMDLLEHCTSETLKKMDEFIGIELVDVAVSLKCLPEGEKSDEYRRKLDLNIDRLNHLTWIKYDVD